MKYYYFLYKTTCVITNKYYIGVHSAKNLGDGYLGSGTLLRHSVNKYGKQQHKREILEYFSSKIQMYAREKEFITTKILTDKRCLNLKPGGFGGLYSKEHHLKMVKAAKNRRDFLQKNDLEWYIQNCKSISNGVKMSYLNGRKNASTWGIKQQKAAWSPEAIEKRQKTFLDIEHQRGEKNSQYGTCWVSNSVHTIKIKIELLEEYISKGYIRGRKLIST